MKTSRMIAVLMGTIGALAMASIALPQTQPLNGSEQNSAEQAMLDVVAKRISAYNAHNIQQFLAAHDEDVGIYEYPERLIGEGRSHLQRIFAPQFARGEGAVEVVMQRVLGNRVVSEEYATVDGETEHLIIIYTIENGRITSLRLIE